MSEPKGANKPQRPRPATRRTLPPDAPSLEQMIRSVDRQLRVRGAHLKVQPHDYSARRGFEMLHGQRGRAIDALVAIDPLHAVVLMIDLGLSRSIPPQVSL